MSDYIDNIDDILSMDDLPTAELVIPEWGGKTVRLRSLSSAERDEYESSQMSIDKKGKPVQNTDNLRARLAALVLIKADGSKLVTNSKVVQFLGGKSSKALDRIFDKATEMNGLDDVEVDKIAADFKSAPDADSDSD